jgi:hypothetical protein
VIAVTRIGLQGYSAAQFVLLVGWLLEASSRQGSSVEPGVGGWVAAAVVAQQGTWRLGGGTTVRLFLQAGIVHATASLLAGIVHATASLLLWLITHGISLQISELSSTAVGLNTSRCAAEPQS